MRFLVCFKVVRDLDSVTEGEWASAALPHPDLSFTKRILNPFDECALETALRLRDDMRQQGCEPHLTALTLCGEGEPIDNFTKNLFAAGYDEIQLLRCAQDFRFRPAAVSRLLTGAIRQLDPFDLLLFGCQAGYGDSGQVPLRISAALNIRCLNRAERVRYCSGFFEVRCRMDGGHIVRTAAPPLLLAMGNAEYSYLRMATLREKMAASKWETIEYTVKLDDAPDDASDDARLLSLSRPDTARRPEMLQGDDAAGKTALLYHTYLKERLVENL